MATEVTFGKGITGFLARPDAPGRRPAVINLHERYGVDKHTTDIADRFAREGYVGFAPDMFSRFTGDRDVLRRGDDRSEIADDEALSDLDEAIAYLRSLDCVDPDRIGIAGFCQTGRQPILAAANRTDLSSIIVAYGGVGDREWEPNPLRPNPISTHIAGITCPVLGLFGEADQVISLDNVLQFQYHLSKANKSYHIRLYRDMPHGWLNDTMPGRYRPEGAEDAWQLMLSFLGKTFGDGWDRTRVTWSFDSNVSPDYDFSKNVRLA